MDADADVQGFFRHFLARLQAAVPMLEDMDRQLTFIAAKPGFGSRSVVPPLVGPTVLGVAVAFGVFVWLVFVASPLLTFSLAALAAVTWCRWLEGHPDALTAVEPQGQGTASSHSTAATALE
jgi:hypothetical protein